MPHIKAYKHTKTNGDIQIHIPYKQYFNSLIIFETLTLNI